MSAKKLSSGETSASGGFVQQWLVRMPGGPLRLLRSDKVISENKVKEIYLDDLKFVRSEAKSNPEAVWPALKEIDTDTVRKDYPWLLKESMRTNHRGLIEWIGGKIVRSFKELKPRRKITERVEITTSGD